MAICRPLPGQAEDRVERFDVTARPITQFRIGSSERRFGALEFVGGLALTAANREFGGMSAIRFLDAGRNFLGVTDTGFWYAGSIERDAEGRPSGIRSFRMAPLIDASGEPFAQKWNADAESLAISGDKVTVGFEREHRLLEYRLDTQDFASLPKALPLPLPREELRRNASLEAVAVSPASGPLGGTRVVLTEKSLNRNGDIFAAVLAGPRRGIFFVRRTDDFDISDAAFLPDGDLLILERRYALVSGVALRIRRIKSETIQPGATVDGAILLKADMGYQIDNMEGIDVWTDSRGRQVLSLISDDNYSLWQRNLYLEFRLAE
ncbi:esterase-like activity of phytase family protein [Paramesorhizobium deserti]|uniref:esterase-like activity of phytase family protein n=1 Tax=Paramesorhizobium deserti TaxID=1494590 RepID=UPI00129061EA|nr:esterase-like activity of phytase family protein [Paramesorhizobium deserti]